MNVISKIHKMFVEVNGMEENEVGKGKREEVASGAEAGGGDWALPQCGEPGFPARDTPPHTHTRGRSGSVRVGGGTKGMTGAEFREAGAPSQTTRTERGLEHKVDMEKRPWPRHRAGRVRVSAPRGSGGAGLPCPCGLSVYLVLHAFGRLVIRSIQH